MRKKFVLAVFLVCATAVGFVPTPALALGATTNPASDITQAGAVLSGTVTRSSGNYIEVVAISPSSNFSEPAYTYSGTCDTTQQVQFIRGSVFDVLGGSGTFPVTFDLTNWNPTCSMQPLTTYYFRIGIQDPVNDSCAYLMSCYTWGQTRSFTTRAALLPTATSGSAAEVGPDSAVLNASVTATDGKADVTFEYGTSPTLVGAKSVSSGQVNPPSGYWGGIPQPTIFSGTQKLTGLIEQTTYYYRVVATSIYGTTRGEIKSFTTKPPVGISINDAAEFTNTTRVTISVSWPVNAESILISNDGGFRTQQAVPLTETIDWTLLSSGDERLPKTVYLKFVLADGSRSSVYADDIILDTTAPVLTQATGSAVSSSVGVTVTSLRPGTKKNATRLRITGKDGNSGVASVQIKTSATGAITTVPVNALGVVSTTIVVKSSKKTYFVRMIDRAGNPTKSWKTVKVRT